MTTWLEVNVRDNSNTLCITLDEVIHRFLTRALAEIREKGNPIEAEIWSNTVPLGSDTEDRIYFFSPDLRKLGTYGNKWVYFSKEARVEKERLHPRQTHVS
jgi:hypothetical protein